MPAPITETQSAANPEPAVLFADGLKRIKLRTLAGQYALDLTDGFNWFSMLLTGQELTEFANNLADELA